VDAGDLLPGDGEHAERVGFAQVFLRREGQLLDVLELPDVIRMHASRVEFGAIERNVLIRRAHAVLQAAELERAEFVPRHALLGVQFGWVRRPEAGFLGAWHRYLRWFDRFHCDSIPVPGDGR
jgi:hypothetical protein